MITYDFKKDLKQLEDISSVRLAHNYYDDSSNPIQKKFKKNWIYQDFERSICQKIYLEGLDFLSDNNMDNMIYSDKYKLTITHHITENGEEYLLFREEKEGSTDTIYRVMTIDSKLQLIGACWSCSVWLRLFVGQKEIIEKISILKEMFESLPNTKFVINPNISILYAPYLRCYPYPRIEKELRNVDSSEELKEDEEMSQHYFDGFLFECMDENPSILNMYKEYLKLTDNADIDSIEFTDKNHSKWYLLYNVDDSWEKYIPTKNKV